MSGVVWHNLCEALNFCFQSTVFFVFMRNELPQITKCYTLSRLSIASRGFYTFFVYFVNQVFVVS